MADNVLLPLTGSGDATASAATENIGGAHYQKIKLFDGSAGSTVGIVGTLTNGLTVDVTRVQGTSSIVGQVSVAGNPSVVNAGTFAVQASVVSGNVSVVGQVSVVGTPSVAPTQTSVVGQITIVGSVTVAQVTSTNLNARVDNAGTFAVQATVTAGNVSVVGQVSVVGTPQVVGNVADGTAASGNPVTNALVARQTNRTAVADGAVVRAAADDMGRILTQPYQPRDLISHNFTQIVNSTVETTIIPQIASTFLDVISLVVTNQTGTAVNVTIKDAAAGTTRMIIALAANGGAVICPSGIIPQLAAVGNSWTATLSALSITVDIFAHYAKNV